MKNGKMGVFLTRMQPITRGHMEVIKRMIAENERVCIIIGSAEKCGDIGRNPFSYKERYELLKHCLATEVGINIESQEKWVDGYEHKPVVTVFGLADWLGENNQYYLNDWGHYLYYSIVHETGEKEFNFYYGEGVHYLDSWFDSEVKNHITIVELDRHKKGLDGVSATALRDVLMTEDLGEHRASWLLPESLVEHEDKLVAKMKFLLGQQQ